MSPERNYDEMQDHVVTKNMCGCGCRGVTSTDDVVTGDVRRITVRKKRDIRDMVNRTTFLLASSANRYMHARGGFGKTLENVKSPTNTDPMCVSFRLR